MAIIYKITNKTNNKSYIGATITSLKSRWNRHCTDSKMSRDGQALHAAIRKYGKDNFILETLYEHPDQNHVFNTMESQFIKEHKTHGSEGGYNMTQGGDGWLNMKHTPETIEKMRNIKLGKKVSPETRQKLSEANTGREAWNKGLECPQLGNYRRGKIYTDEEKEKFSRSHQGLLHSAETKEKIKKNIAESHIVKNTTTGEIFEITNLYEFCKQNSISTGNLVALHKTKNYQLLQTTKKIRTYTIKNLITNETTTCPNLAAFCRPLGIANAGLLSKYKLNKPYMNYQIMDINITEQINTF